MTTNTSGLLIELIELVLQLAATGDEEHLVAACELLREHNERCC
jgi:hypothetical protein